MSRLLVFHLSDVNSYTDGFESANRYDVVITEFLSDPTPAVGLPESEFIELKTVPWIIIFTTDYQQWY